MGVDTTDTDDSPVRGAQDRQARTWGITTKRTIMNRLGKLFRTRRTEKGLSFHQLAALAGYGNLNKGSNRIQRFESSGKIAPDLFAKLASILEVSPDEVRRSLAEDYREWLAWANVPIRPYVVSRLMACVYQRSELPDDALSTEAATDYAAKLARDSKRMIWLVLSRRVSIRFDATGKADLPAEATPEMPSVPYVTIGGKRVNFDFSERNVLRQIDEPSR
jgi:transcriptional regulator with XRE-family HTH domain